MGGYGIYFYSVAELFLDFHTFVIMATGPSGFLGSFEMNESDLELLRYNVACDYVSNGLCDGFFLFLRFSYHLKMTVVTIACSSKFAPNLCNVFLYFGR